MDQKEKQQGCDQFEVYRKCKLLGEGAYGKAFLVQAESSKEFCVIKQVNIQKMSEREREETLKEAQILEVLNHPNIVTFREVYKTKKGHLCIVMDFADGGDLNKLILEQKGRHFDENKILDWFTQICLGMKHVHDRKILHRDIKCQNVFVTKNNIIKLGDFGIARVLKHTVDVAKSIVGTPYYISPEIIENRPYSFKSDIWSLGVLLYELCALKPPFEGSSIHFLSMQIVRGKYPSLPAHFSREIKTLVGQLLVVDVRRRININQILKQPIIAKRIKYFLNDNTFKQEFSHTILHNQNIMLQKDLLQQQVAPKNNLVPSPRYINPQSIVEVKVPQKFEIRAPSPKIPDINIPHQQFQALRQKDYAKVQLDQIKERGKQLKVAKEQEEVKVYVKPLPPAPPKPNLAKHQSENKNQIPRQESREELSQMPIQASREELNSSIKVAILKQKQKVNLNLNNQPAVDEVKNNNLAFFCQPQDQFFDPKENEAFERYHNEMSQFLNQQGNDINDDSEDENDLQPENNFIRTRNADREKDVLEEDEVIKEVIEPLNLEDLKISSFVDANSFDTREYFKQLLVDRYGSSTVEKALIICQQYDCYQEENLIVKELTRPGLLEEENAKQLLSEISCLLILV